MALTQESPKFWHPDPKLVDWLTNKKIPAGARVLEIGPGTVPFARADYYVDFVDIPNLKNFIKIDVGTSRLPFADKEFDFIYTRHIHEDMWNPFNLCEEMSRVGKAGYIETPSPLAEMARGVDGGSPPFRGYHHHRWVIWAAGAELRFVTKYAFCEYVKFEEDKLDDALKTERFWNTHFIWDERINFKHIQSPLDYSIPQGYAKLLADAMVMSRSCTDLLYDEVNAAS